MLWLLHICSIYVQILTCMACICLLLAAFFSIQHVLMILCRFLFRLNYVISWCLKNFFKVFVDPEDILIIAYGLSDFWRELVICNYERCSVSFFWLPFSIKRSVISSKLTFSWRLLISVEITLLLWHSVSISWGY